MPQQPCPAGTSAASGTGLSLPSTCSPCAAGTYSSGAVSTCSACPAGSYCIGMYVNFLRKEYFNKKKTSQQVQVRQLHAQ